MKYSIVQGTTDTPFCRDINTFVYITQMPCPESAIDDGVEFRRIAVCKEFSDANSLACAYSKHISGANELPYSTISIDETGVKDQIRRYAMPMIQNIVHIPGSKKSASWTCSNPNCQIMSNAANCCADANLQRSHK